MSRRRSPGNSKTDSTSLLLWTGIALLVLVVIGALVLTGVGTTSAAKKTNGIDFTLNDFAGKSVRLSDYRGKPVLVNLWASWCPPCRAEMPDLIKYYNEHQAEGLVLLAIDSEDDREAAQQFIREKQMPFPVLFDPNALAARAFGSKGLPSTFLIDRTGAVRFSWTGQISTTILDQRVTPLLTQ